MDRERANVPYARLKRLSLDMQNFKDKEDKDDIRIIIKSDENHSNSSAIDTEFWEPVSSANRNHSDHDQYNIDWDQTSSCIGEHFARIEFQNYRWSIENEPTIVYSTKDRGEPTNGCYFKEETW